MLDGPNRSKSWCFAQYGGPDIPNPTVAVGREFRQIFDAVEGRSYPGVVSKISIRLFVSGELTTFEEPSGFTDIRLFLQRQEVKCDLVVQQDIWKVGVPRMRTFLRDTFREALQQIGTKLEKRKVEFDTVRLLSDLESAGM